MLSDGSACYPITSSPLISPRFWKSRITQLRYGDLQGVSGTAMLQDGLGPSHSSGSWQRFASHSWIFCSLAIAVLFHTRQGFPSLAAWISRSPSVRRSSSSRKGTSQVTYVTMVPRANETLRRRAILLASLLEANTGCILHVLLSLLVIMSPAHDVMPIVCTDYTYDSEHGIAEGVPLCIWRSVSFHRGTMVT